MGTQSRSGDELYRQDFSSHKHDFRFFFWLQLNANNFNTSNKIGSSIKIIQQYAIRGGGGVYGGLNK
jgi:hypothetical protein